MWALLSFNNFFMSVFIGQIIHAMLQYFEKDPQVSFFFLILNLSLCSLLTGVSREGRKDPYFISSVPSYKSLVLWRLEKP